MNLKLVPILIDFLTEKVAISKRHKGRQEGPIFSQTKEAIKNSIENRWLLNIYYEGDKENSPGRRWIEPLVWGNNIYTGNEVLRAWQYRGKTESIERGYKMFRLDRIRNTAPLTSKTFDRPRPKYHADDKLMSGIKMAVEFPKDKKNKNTIKRMKGRI